MISPAMAAMIAAIRTAPAAVSLAIFARGLYSLVTRSTTDSTAVFTSSSAITSPKRPRQMHHSTGESFRMMPAITTKMCIRDRCMVRLITSRSNYIKQCIHHPFLNDFCAYYHCITNQIHMLYFFF